MIRSLVYEVYFVLFVTLKKNEFDRRYFKNIQNTKMPLLEHTCIAVSNANISILQVTKRTMTH